MARDTFDFEQDAQIARVHASIGAAVLDYCRRNREFHGDELCDHVKATCGGSAESARRIMRDLRRQGRLDYTNVSRAASRYRVEWVK
jgi:hypothetical protein